MSETLKGVIFDHSTLLLDLSKTAELAELREVMLALKKEGVKLIIFSTHPTDITTELRRRNLPSIDLFLTQSDLDAISSGHNSRKKGSTLWIEETARRLGIPTYRLLYVGDDARDWREAINSATIYLHARWVRPLTQGMTAFMAKKPRHVFMFASHFLMIPPRWEYRLDRPDDGLYLRSLVSASQGGVRTQFPATNPQSFTTLDVLHKKMDVRVGGSNARNLLALHAILSLYLEGLIPRNPYIIVYPSSKVQSRIPILQEFLASAAKLFHGFYQDDLLVRKVDAIDTSEEKWRASQGGREPNVSMRDQTSTVCLNPKYQGNLHGRTVILVDDFSTTGKSLEWGRNLLLKGGAERVITVSIGKYGGYHTLYSPKDREAISPFTLDDFDPNEVFEEQVLRMERDTGAYSRLRQSFQALVDGQPYPL